jgi:hypothetical protein
MMTPADWHVRYLAVSAELAHLAAGKLHRPDENVSEHEGALLEELDDLELTAAAMVRAGTA